MRFHTQAALDAHARTLMNAEQITVFDQLMATETWKVNQTMSDSNRQRTVVWFSSAADGKYVIGLDTHGKIHRPIKGKTGISFNRTTLERVYK